MKVRFYGNEYDTLEVKDLTQHELKKMAWVSDSLGPFLSTLGTGITKAEYVVIDHEVELVLVWFDDCYKTVNVTMDSYASMVEDCYRQKVIY